MKKQILKAEIFYQLYKHFYVPYLLWSHARAIRKMSTIMRKYDVLPRAGETTMERWNRTAQPDGTFRD